MKQRREIRAAKMFLPVVAILFLCNVEPIIHYIFVVCGNLYREMCMGMLLCFTFNSAANLPIYYLKGSSFRRETRALLHSYFPKLVSKIDKRQRETLAENAMLGITTSANHTGNGLSGTETSSRDGLETSSC